MIENVRVDALTDPTDRLMRTPLSDSDGPRIIQGGSPLDSERIVKMHQWAMAMVLYEKRRQASNRMQMALDCNYYDGDQFTDEDIMELLDRGQAPLVYNLVKRTADWVIGTEKRTRFDFKVLGRTKDDVASARLKTDIMKYYDDVNRTPFHRSQAFREAVIAGVGWLEDGVRGDPDEEPIYSGSESWWFTLHDSHAMKLDNTDARYHVRWKYVDCDIAEAWFPERQQFIANSARNGAALDEKIMDEFYLGNRLAGEDYLAGQYSRLNWSNQGYIDSTRERVKIYEMWFKMPVYEKTMRSKRLPQFHGMPYNAANDDHRHALIVGDASIVERVNMRVFYIIFTESGVLAAGRSPYRHNEFPFTPVWCYRRGRDNAPYGIIRNIRDPQDGFNRRMAKAIFALTAYRVTADSNAIDEKKQSWDDVRVEAGRPDAMIVRKPGTEIKVEQDRELGEEHLKLAQTEGSLILDASGVTADNLGLESNAESGKAIIAKQSEGAAVTAEIFDNYRLAGQLQGEKRLSNIEQFVSEEKAFRISDAKGRPNWKKVNEISVDPETGEARVLNDITATKADFVIDQQDFRATMRQAANEALMAILPKFGGMDPMLVLRLLRMAIDVSDWPNKEEMVKEVDSITGYKDPDDALTEDEKAEQQKADEEKKQAEAEQKQMQQQAFAAELGEKIASANLKKAQAEKALAEAQRAMKDAQEGAPQGVDPAEAQRLAADLEACQKELDARDMDIRELQIQLRDRAAEIESNERALKHKADREHDAAVATANAQFPKGAIHPAHEEAMADVLQAVEELRSTVAELKGDDGGKALEPLIKTLEQAVKTSGAGAMGGINLTVNGEGVKIDDGANERAERAKRETDDQAKREAAEAKREAAEEKRAQEEAKRRAEELAALVALGEQIRSMGEEVKKAVAAAKPEPAAPVSKVITLPDGAKVRVDPVPPKKEK